MTTRRLPADFARTRWSLVLKAGDRDPATAQASLVALCERCRYPVYAYLRRSGHAPERALAQAGAFFDGLLRDGIDHGVAMRHGRFRLFLLDELHRFLAVDAAQAPSRDPVADASSTLASFEARHLAASGTPGSPEEMLRRGFAVEVMDAAQRRLREEAVESGHEAMFGMLADFLGSEPRPGEYDAVARQLGVRPLFVSMAVKRLRQRFRELVDRELAETLSNPADMDDERDALLRVSMEPPG